MILCYIFKEKGVKIKKYKSIFLTLFKDLITLWNLWQPLVWCEKNFTRKNFFVFQLTCNDSSSLLVKSVEPHWGWLIFYHLDFSLIRNATVIARIILHSWECHTSIWHFYRACAKFHGTDDRHRLLKLFSTISQLPPDFFPLAWQTTNIRMESQSLLRFYYSSKSHKIHFYLTSIVRSLMSVKKTTYSEGNKKSYFPIRWRSGSKSQMLTMLF